MAATLEVPDPQEDPDWNHLYLYRGSDATGPRLLFTGDVYFDVEVQGVGGIEHKDVMVVQHPCALRTNGVALVDSISVVEVTKDRLSTAKDWAGNYKFMPLPGLLGTGDETADRAALFTSNYLAVPSWLPPSKRVACMDKVGVNLLLQRWVYHNGRVIVRTSKYEDVTGGPFEEASCIEDWCEIRGHVGIQPDAAIQEANTWLDDKGDVGIRRRNHLENPQYRSAIRKKMRAAAKSLNKP